MSVSSRSKTRSFGFESAIWATEFLGLPLDDKEGLPPGIEGEDGVLGGEGERSSFRFLRFSERRGKEAEASST
jgi:hypothetical protein